MFRCGSAPPYAVELMRPAFGRATGRRADLRVRIAQIDDVEQVHHLDADLDILAAAEAEVLEDRRVGPAVVRPSQRVAFQVTKGPDGRVTKRAALTRRSAWC